MPRPTPNTWVPTWYFSGTTRKNRVPNAATCRARITAIRPAVRKVSSRRQRKDGRGEPGMFPGTVESDAVIRASRSSTSWITS